MENKHICHAEELRVTYVNNPPSQKRRVTPSPHVHRLPSREDSKEREIPDIRHLNQVTWSTSPAVLIVSTFDMIWWLWQFLSVVFLCKTYHPMIKISDQFQWTDIPPNTWLGPSKTVNTTKHKESLIKWRVCGNSLYYLCNFSVNLELF